MAHLLSEVSARANDTFPLLSRIEVNDTVGRDARTVTRFVPATEPGKLEKEIEAAFSA